MGLIFYFLMLEIITCSSSIYFLSHFSCFFIFSILYLFFFFLKEIVAICSFLLQFMFCSNPATLKFHVS